VEIDQEGKRFDQIRLCADVEMIEMIKSANVKKAEATPSLSSDLLSIPFYSKAWQDIKRRGGQPSAAGTVGAILWADVRPRPDHRHRCRRAARCDRSER